MADHSMPSQLNASARSLADFFARALSSFQSSGSKLHIVCTVAPTPPHHERPDHGLPRTIPPRTRPPTLIVLDSSFNPPTRAHLRMARCAIRDLADKKGQRPSTLRLLLLLSVNNADKEAKPAAFDKRLALMWAFARDLRHDLQSEREPASVEERDEAPIVDLGLSTLPYFHDKSAAIAESSFYTGEGEGEGEGDSADCPMEQVFLVGYDTLIRIFNPKYYGPPESTAQLAGADTTPMRKALGPFFARAKLRVTIRPGDEWGEKDEQIAYFEDLLQAEGLSKVGGSTEWASRIEMVEGRSAGEDAISSTYARGAARDRDSDRLNTMVTPEVRWWIEHEGLYTE
ncbi:hypothetical protein VTK56DRAFT_10210 [Thermocarpiscus australiensis]